MKKIPLILVITVFTIIAIYTSIRFLPTCDLEIARENPGAINKECQCSGIKVTVENTLPVDGQLRTVCVGISSPK